MFYLYNFLEYRQVFPMGQAVSRAKADQFNKVLEVHPQGDKDNPILPSFHAILPLQQELH